MHLFILFFSSNFLKILDTETVTTKNLKQVESPQNNEPAIASKK